jgi:anti-anti-sigma regulatory factor
MSVSGTFAIRVGRTAAGFLVCIEGRGTMRESPLLQAFAGECLGRENRPLVVDLSQCTYLDSTFLGCLVGLHRRFGRASPPRFVVAASAAQRQRLLAPLQLHRVLELVDEAPPGPDHWLTLCEGEPEKRAGREQLGRHVLDCHRHLADLGGANEEVFGPIIEQLIRELEQSERAKDARPEREPAYASS